MRALPQNVIRTFNFSDFNNLAVLHYDGAPDAIPAADPTVNIPVSQLPLVETNLHVRYVPRVFLIPLLMR